MTEKPLVSIIVPIYNVEQYIRRCIDSIINQSYKNIELILVDDGSPDNCPKICDEYASKYDHITVIHQKNFGLSSARNRGMDIAKGEYISFVDSDDYLHKDFVLNCLRIIAQKNVGIVQCSFLTGSDDSFPKILMNSEIIVFNDSRMYGDRNVKITAWGKLYDKTTLNGILFPVGRINEDEFFTYKAIAASGNIAVTSMPLYYYYVNPNSITHKKTDYKPMDFVDAYHERLRFFKKKKDRLAYNLSLKEFAIRLMLYYCSFKSNKNNKNDKKSVLTEYFSIYKKIKFDMNVAFKERLILSIFYYFPNTTAFFINMIRTRG